MYNGQKKQAGFTLIEIVVVIGIIGILAAVIYTSFDGARQQVRNKALLTELKEVQLALELYKAQNNTYPLDTGTYPNNLASGIVTGNFISSVPVASDSRNSNCQIVYDSDGTYYKLTAVRCLEGMTTANGIGINHEFARCPSSCTTCSSPAVAASDAGFYESAAIYSAGGSCN